MRRRVHGSVSMSFLALLLPLLALALTTIMLGLNIQLHNRAMQAADAAALACTYSASAIPALPQAYLDYYQPNIKGLLGESQLGSDCEISIRYHLDGPFSLIGIGQGAYSAHSNALERAYIQHVAKVTPTEMALVLDISSSMADSIDTLKSILGRAIGRFEYNNVKLAGRRAVSIAIVPFSDGVSVKDPTWANVRGVLCANGISKDKNEVFSAKQTVANLDTTYSEKKVELKAQEKFLFDCSGTSPLVPLTDNMREIKHAIDNLETIGGTSSYQGLIWGARQLIPKWRQEWGYRPYSTRPVQKLILMTDGVDASSRLDTLISAGICDRLANEFGIQLNFIGFNVPDHRLKQFRRCANAAIDTQLKGQVLAAANSQELDEYFSKMLYVDYDTTLNFGQK
ncbi:hypothetical protein GCM10007938_28980 [Vibrio zhanjiangensis]|uniref:VWFA domain-containing protein n=1 Tax=Vibrio zhanjiangensis TaxID=1046128 RepID=A0ABQ6F1J4_9VIBR|nr:hypothetical protein [Vibrio zhanjiangensis]GLT19116.1 hypothetical protein GCM10007938_28980 [Vibrio zhanjiangensis]